MNLKVEDEGEYWETGSNSKLQDHIAQIDAMMLKMKQREPGLKGPVILEDGRIIDLME